MVSEHLVSELIAAHLNAVKALQAQETAIAATGNQLIKTLQSGGRVFLCGNGGSAADAQHIAAEMVCRFESTRRALPAIALTTDSSAMTAISNDFGYERIFARQVEALARPGDILVGISTSGASKNISAAVVQAQTLQVQCIGLLGRNGGELLGQVDHAVVIPVENTARIQECHILVGHIWCAMIDAAFSSSQ